MDDIAPYAYMPTYPGLRAADIEAAPHLVEPTGPVIWADTGEPVRAPYEAPVMQPVIPAMQGLGQAEPFDPMAWMRGTVKAVKPFADCLGAHPTLSLSLFMLAVIVGGAVGGYIGASAQEVKKGR